MHKYTEDQLKEFARKLKDKQDELEPCLTYEQMLRALGYKHDYSITKIMRRLVDSGFAKEVEFDGVRNRYRIL